MLAAKIKETKELIKEADIIKTKANHYDRYQDLIERVKGVGQVCSPYFTSITNLAKEITNFEKDDLSEEIEIILTCIENLENNNIPNTNQISDIRNLINVKETELKDKWKSYIKEESKDLKNTLGLLEGLYSDKSNIQAILDDIRKYENKWPVQKEVIDGFRSTLSGATHIIEELDIKENIQEFLRLVISGDARLSHVTPEIKAWMDKTNDFSENIKLSFLR